MARLPTPGGDDGSWGSVLNDFLDQAHNTDGTLKTSAISAAGAEQASNKGVAGGYAPLDGSGQVPAANLPPAGAVPDATASSKGIVQLSGDLAGTATSPQIAAGVIVDADINASANIAQSKINNLPADLAGKANDADVVHDTGNETIAGIKTFNSAPVVPNDSFTQAKVLNLTTDLAGKANSSHTHAQADVTNLTTDLAAKYTLPGTGIPKTDLAAAVQTSLDNADATTTGLSNHIADAADAHDASAISLTPVGGIAATDVQAAIAELDTEKSVTSHTHTAADVGAVKATDGGQETAQNHGNSGTTETIDLVNGNNHRLVLDNSCTLTFTGATNGQGCSFTLILIQDAVGGRTVTWPASVKWSLATPPSLSTGANDVDILTFMTIDGGTTWYGFFAGKGMA